MQKTKLTAYTNRTQIPGEYKMVSYKTKEYDLLKKYHNMHITEEESEIILKWLARSCQMELIINFRNCGRSWGGKRRGKPFVTIAKWEKNVGVLIHEFAHAHNYHFGSGSSHNDGFIRTFDKFIKKFHNSKAREIVTIKERYN